MRYLETPMSRRRAVATIASASVAIGGVVLTGRSGLAQGEADRHTSQQYAVSVNVNLRSGASTSHRVISVVPKGAIIRLNGQTSNGFANVTWQDKTGWVYATYIHPVPSGHETPVIVGEGSVTANVNLRSGPGLNYKVLRVVRAGNAVMFSNSVQNGFRYVSHDGLAGWMSEQFIRLPGHGPVEERFTATAPLNLRAEPSLSARVLLVIPSGATVVGLDGGAGQFRKVNYKGTVGWAAYAYLT